MFSVRYFFFFVISILLLFNLITAFLISELEQLSTYLKSDRSLVPKSFVAMELPIDALLEIYNR
jgi:hypothetical protein